MTSTPTDSPGPVSVSGPRGPAEPPGRRVRWGLVAATTIGGLMVISGLAQHWLSARVHAYGGSGGYQTSTADIPLGEIEAAWAQVLEVGLPVLVVLVVAAVVGPGRWRRAAAAGALVAAGVVVVAVGWGWVDLQRPARAVAETVAVLEGGGSVFVPWSVDRITPAVVAAGAVVLAQVAAHVRWPRSAPRVLAAAGVASAVAWVAVPYAVAWMTADGPEAVEARPSWLVAAGGTGALAVALMGVLVGLAIKAVVGEAARLRSVALGSVVIGMLVVVTAAAVGLDGARRGPAVVSYVEATFSHMILGCAVSFLVLACLLAWRPRPPAPAATSAS